MSSVFISYSSKDRSFAEKLASDLELQSVQVWYDQWELQIGDSLIEKIGAGIHTNDYLIVVLSKTSVRSEWVKKELNAALTRELKEKKVIVLPLLLEECKMPPFLSDKLYADFRYNYQDGLRKLMMRLKDQVIIVKPVSNEKLAKNVTTKNIITSNIINKIVEPEK